MRLLKTVLIVLLVGCLLGVGGVAMVGCSSFGSLPSDEQVAAYQNSLNYDKERKVFVNRRPRLVEEMRKRTMNFATTKEFLFGGDAERIPSEALPEVRTDFARFSQAGDDLKVVWFGHSSVLMKLDGKNVLIDPVLSTSTGPFGFMMKRFQKPVIELSELPEIDVIIVSHDHWDHLDMDSIKFFKNKSTRFVVPLGVAAHLTGWGIEASRIQELDWWQGVEIAGIKFTATPAQHFSGRGFTNQNKSLWASWVIKSSKHNVYFCADSGYDTHFKDIGEKMGPFDLAFIENGQYNEKWREVHLLPDESIQAFKDLNAKRYFPIHWGMFSLALHSWSEPIEKISAATAREGISLVAPQIGEVVTINDQYVTQTWWKKNNSAKAD
ncbi:MBL fold metallo-hydrolase [Bdellovibrio bacteriovorus]|nr:MBL fold metallo-hydrolase [Bdellovibrio bacteriovorus]AHZ86159.1 hydrolase [Bdellovibrio bacteriovorus]BEV67394.1 hypothetical protein Bb109J_c0814 [Bdellovibrio bacteriovorus]